METNALILSVSGHSFMKKLRKLFIVHMISAHMCLLCKMWKDTFKIPAFIGIIALNDQLVFTN
jgi:hypothetical protein